MTEIGAMGPNFTLPANEGTPITLSDFQGKKNVVLSFHIYSFTGG
ncbi:redoxin domain-containing protein [SAR202 cluster bacterium AD-802-K11_MRT_200m]|nr:redoxin domain-containing protein [SAR202 cluster bacterium AD-802-K11_MRT_200m]